MGKSQFEQCERRFLPATLSADGILLISGSADDDVVDVSLAGGEIIVSQNAQNSDFDAADVEKLQFDLLGGDNRIEVAFDIDSTIKSLLGNDTIALAGGDNEVQLNGGTDSLVIGGSGTNLVLAFGGGFVDITTGAGPDKIEIGRRGIVRAGGGDDQIFLEDRGNDSANEPVTVMAGAGNDSVRPSRDFFGKLNPVTIFGGDGNDSILGNAGRQIIFGEGGKDTVLASTGSDLVSGGGGKDSLFGGGGNDRVYGGAADDRLFGEGGNDLLDGGAGSDIIHGNGGNDTFIATDGVPDQLFGDGGSDQATRDPIDAITSIEEGTIVP